MIMIMIIICFFK